MPGPQHRLHGTCRHFRNAFGYLSCDVSMLDIDWDAPGPDTVPGAPPRTMDDGGTILIRADAAICGNRCPLYSGRWNRLLRWVARRVLSESTEGGDMNALKWLWDHRPGRGQRKLKAELLGKLADLDELIQKAEGDQEAIDVAMEEMRQRRLGVVPPYRDSAQKAWEILRENRLSIVHNPEGWLVVNRRGVTLATEDAPVAAVFAAYTVIQRDKAILKNRRPDYDRQPANHMPRRTVRN